MQKHAHPIARRLQSSQRSLQHPPPTHKLRHRRNRLIPQKFLRRKPPFQLRPFRRIQRRHECRQISRRSINPQQMPIRTIHPLRVHIALDQSRHRLPNRPINRIPDRQRLIQRLRRQNTRAIVHWTRPSQHHLCPRHHKLLRHRRHRPTIRQLSRMTARQKNHLRKPIAKGRRQVRHRRKARLPQIILCQKAGCIFRQYRPRIHLLDPIAISLGRIDNSMARQIKDIKIARLVGLHQISQFRHRTVFLRHQQQRLLLRRIQNIHLFLLKIQLRHILRRGRHKQELQRTILRCAFYPIPPCHKAQRITHLAPCQQITCSIMKQFPRQMGHLKR